MKVLFVTMFYRPEPVPKPHELAEGLAARGHDVEVITGFPNYPFGKFFEGYRPRPWRIDRINGVRVIRVPVYANHSGRAMLRALSIVTFFFGIFYGALFIRKKPDVIYVWGNPPTSGLAALMLCKLLRAKLVYGIYDLWPDLAVDAGMFRPGLVARVIGRIEDFVVKAADRAVSISAGFVDVLVKRGARRETMSIIPHWADEAIYKPVEKDPAVVRELGAENRFVVLYAGNVGRLQALDRLVGAATLLRDRKELLFVIVGDGVERKRLETMVQEAALTNVTFIDPQSQERVVAFSAVADVLFVGLIAGRLAQLSIPSKLASCMASGKPLLSTAAGETADVIARAEAGITCEPEAKAIAAALLQLRDMPAEELRKLGNNARTAFLEHFSRERLLIEYEALMMALLSPTSAAVVTV